MSDNREATTEQIDRVLRALKKLYTTGISFETETASPDEVAPVLEAVQDRLTAYDALLVENEKLKNSIHDLNIMCDSFVEAQRKAEANRDYWKREQGEENRRRRQAEAALAHAEPVLAAIGGKGEGEIEWDDCYTTRVARDILRAALKFRDEEAKHENHV